MALENTNQIDIIVKSPHTNGYDLILADGGEVKDEIKRYTFIVDKLTAYASYVLGGQFADEYPDAKDKEIRFCVVCRTSPNEAMLKLEAIKHRSNPEVRFPVIVQTQKEYLKKSSETDTKIQNGKSRKKWWEVWK